MSLAEGGGLARVATAADRSISASSRSVAIHVPPMSAASTTLLTKSVCSGLAARAEGCGRLPAATLAARCGALSVECIEESEASDPGDSASDPGSTLALAGGAVGDTGNCVLETTEVGFVAPAAAAAAAFAASSCRIISANSASSIAGRSLGEAREA